MLLFCATLVTTKDCLLEAMGRAELLTRMVEKVRSGDHSPLATKDALVAERKFEMSAIVTMLLGNVAKSVYVVFVCLYVYGTLWAFSSVFAASLSANVPIVFLDTQTCDVEADPGCLVNFRIWEALFAAIVIPLSLLDLSEQKVVQVLMAAARAIVILLLVCTVYAAVGCKGVAFTAVQPHLEGKTYEPYGVMARPAGLGVLIPIAVFSQIFHVGIPSLAEPLADKSHLARMFSAAFAVVLTAYMILGTSLAAYFGQEADSQINLNWAGYVGCVHREAGDPRGEVHNDERSLWAAFTATVVLIFPALDVASAFPLNAISLGDSLLAVWQQPAALEADEGEAREPASPSEGLLAADETTLSYEAVTADLEDSPASPAEDVAPHHSQDVPQTDATSPRGCLSYCRVGAAQRTKLAFRVLAAVPPLVGAFFVNKLDTILTYTGLAGIVLAMITPALLSAASKIAVERALPAFEAWRVANAAGSDHALDSATLESLQQTVPVRDIFAALTSGLCWRASKADEHGAYSILPTAQRSSGQEQQETKRPSEPAPSELLRSAYSTCATALWGNASIMALGSVLLVYSLIATIASG